MPTLDEIIEEAKQGNNLTLDEIIEVARLEREAEIPRPQLPKGIPLDQIIQQARKEKAQEGKETEVDNIFSKIAQGYRDIRRGAIDATTAGLNTIDRALSALSPAYVIARDTINNLLQKRQDISNQLVKLGMEYDEIARNIGDIENFMRAISGEKPEDKSSKALQLAYNTAFRYLVGTGVLPEPNIKGYKDYIRKYRENYEWKGINPLDMAEAVGFVQTLGILRNLFGIGKVYQYGTKAQKVANSLKNAVATGLVATLLSKTQGKSSEEAVDTGMAWTSMYALGDAFMGLGKAGLSTILAYGEKIIPKLPEPLRRNVAKAYLKAQQVMPDYFREWLKTKGVKTLSKLREHAERFGTERVYDLAESFNDVLAYSIQHAKTPEQFVNLFVANFVPFYTANVTSEIALDAVMDFFGLPNIIRNRIARNAAHKWIDRQPIPEDKKQIYHELISISDANSVKTILDLIKDEELEKYLEEDETYKEAKKQYKEIKKITKPAEREAQKRKIEEIRRAREVPEAGLYPSDGEMRTFLLNILVDNGIDEDFAKATVAKLKPEQVKAYFSDYKARNDWIDRLYEENPQWREIPQEQREEEVKKAEEEIKVEEKPTEAVEVSEIEEKEKSKEEKSWEILGVEEKVWNMIKEGDIDAFIKYMLNTKYKDELERMSKRLNEARIKYRERKITDEEWSEAVEKYRKGKDRLEFKIADKFDELRGKAEKLGLVEPLQPILTKEELLKIGTGEEETFKKPEEEKSEVEEIAIAQTIRKKKPWEMNPKELQILYNELTKIVKPTASGDIWLTKDTDVSKIINLNPYITVTVEDTDGARMDMSIAEFQELQSYPEFRDRIRKARISFVAPRQHYYYDSQRGRYVPEQKFMGIDIGEVKKLTTLDITEKDTSRTNINPEEIKKKLEGIKLVNNSTVKRENKRKFVEAITDENIIRYLKFAGVKEIIIEPPYKFGITEEAVLDKKNKVIRINADARNPKQSLEHEIGHLLWESLTPKQREIIRDLMIENNIGEGYLKNKQYEEAFADNIISNEKFRELLEKQPEVSKVVKPEEKPEEEKPEAVSEKPKPTKEKKPEEKVKTEVEIKQDLDKIRSEIARLEEANRQIEQKAKQRYEEYWRKNPNAQLTNTNTTISSFMTPEEMDTFYANENKLEKLRLQLRGITKKEDFKRLIQLKRELRRRGIPFESNITISEAEKLLEEQKKEKAEKRPTKEKVRKAVKEVTGIEKSPYEITQEEFLKDIERKEINIPQELAITSHKNQIERALKEGLLSEEKARELGHFEKYPELEKIVKPEEKAIKAEKYKKVEKPQEKAKPQPEQKPKKKSKPKKAPVLKAEITPEQARELKKLGYTESQIVKIRPAQAREIIEEKIPPDYVTILPNGEVRYVLPSKAKRIWDILIEARGEGLNDKELKNKILAETGIDIPLNVIAKLKRQQGLGGVTKELFDVFYDTLVNSIIQKDKDGEELLKKEFGIDDKEIDEALGVMGAFKGWTKEKIKRAKRLVRSFLLVHPYLVKKAPFVADHVSDYWAKFAAKRAQLARLENKLMQIVDNPKTLADLIVEADIIERTSGKVINVDKEIDRLIEEGELTQKDKAGYFLIKSVRRYIHNLIEQFIIEKKLGFRVEEAGYRFKVRYKNNQNKTITREVTPAYYEKLAQKFPDIEILEMKQKFTVKFFDTASGNYVEKTITAQDLQEAEKAGIEMAKEAILPYKNYIPHYREGKWWIEVYLTTEDGRLEKIWATRLDVSEERANKIAQKLEKKIGKEYLVQVHEHDDEKFLESPYIGSPLDIQFVLAERGVDLSNPEVQKIIKAFRSVSAVGARLLHSENIPGYRTDLQGIMKGFINLATSLAYREMRNNMMNLRKTILSRVEDDDVRKIALRYVDLFIQPAEKGILEDMMNGATTVAYLFTIVNKSTKIIQDLSEPYWAYLRAVADHKEISPIKLARKMIAPLKPSLKRLMNKAYQDGLLEAYYRYELTRADKLRMLDVLGRQSEKISSALIFKMGLILADEQGLKGEQAYVFARRFLHNEGKPFYNQANRLIGFLDKGSATVRKGGFTLAMWILDFYSKLILGGIRHLITMGLGWLFIGGLKEAPYGSKILDKIGMRGKKVKDLNLLDRFIIGGAFGAIGVDPSFVLPTFIWKYMKTLLHPMRSFDVLMGRLEALMYNYKRYGIYGTFTAIPVLGHYAIGTLKSINGVKIGRRKFYKPKTLREKIALILGLTPIELGELYRRETTRTAVKRRR